MLEYDTWNYLEQQRKPVFVLGWAASVAGVLPVHVKTVKLVSSEKLDRVINEIFPCGLGSTHVGERRSSQVPSSNSDHILHIWSNLPQVGESFVPGGNSKFFRWKVFISTANIINIVIG